MRSSTRPNQTRTRRLQILLGALLSTFLFATTVSVAGAVSGFGDVEDDRFYTDAVAWMVNADITTGIEVGCFGPELPVTRGQVATFLYRFDAARGNDPVAGSHPFADVTASYQQDPVGWLYLSGLTTGITATQFAPDQPITRGDFAVMLWRYAERPSPTAAHPFTDVRSSYQGDAISWMAAEGITTGTSETTFSPAGLISRAEAATFLFRFADPEIGVTGTLAGVDCTRELRLALEAGGLTSAEARCAIPHLLDFDLNYLIRVVEDRDTASVDVIFAAVAIANECLTPERVADLSRLFL